MMTWSVAALAVVLCLGWSPALADDDIRPPRSTNSGFEVGGTEGTLDSLLGPAGIEDVGGSKPPSTPPPPLYVAGVAGGCLGDPEVCTPDVDPATPITQVTVLRALRRIDLPASRLVVQPPGGKTLVNFDTLFRTEAEPFTRTVRLVGHRVDLEITPSSFTWRHGDGTAQTTASPGRAFRRGVPMEEYVSHRYEDAHVTMRPAVDTTYSARFRVDGGPWRDVDGTVTISGSGVDLRVVEGRPTLVGAY